VAVGGWVVVLVGARAVVGGCVDAVAEALVVAANVLAAVTGNRPSALCSAASGCARAVYFLVGMSGSVLNSSLFTNELSKPTKGPVVRRAACLHFWVMVKIDS
jgi:uncharacterized membrane protein YuzA (DUF378 family)